MRIYDFNPSILAFVIVIYAIAIDAIPLHLPLLSYTVPGVSIQVYTFLPLTPIQGRDSPLCSPLSLLRQTNTAFAQLIYICLIRATKRRLSSAYYPGPPAPGLLLIRATFYPMRANVMNSTFFYVPSDLIHRSAATVRD